MKLGTFQHVISLTDWAYDMSVMTCRDVTITSQIHHFEFEAELIEQTEIYGLLVHKPPQFRNMLTKRGIFLFGKKLSLLIVTLTGTADVGSNRLSRHIRLHPNNINRDSRIEIPEAWIIQSESTTSDQPQSGPVREQHLIVRMIMRIKVHQQQRTNVLQIATRKRPTSSPDEDQQYCSRNVAINNSKRFHHETCKQIKVHLACQRSCYPSPITCHSFN